MSDFFDRMVGRLVARANGRGSGAAPLEPRTASRYASPEQHLAPADAPPGADARASDEEATGADMAAPARAPRFDPGTGEALAPQARATDRRNDRAWGAGVEARVAAGPRAAAGESAAQAPGEARPPSLSPAPGARDPSDPARALSPVLDEWIGPEQDGVEWYAPDPARSPSPARAAPSAGDQSTALPPPPGAAAAAKGFPTEDAFWSFLYPSSSSSSSSSPSSSAPESGTAPWAGFAAHTGATFAAGGRDPDETAREAPAITVSIQRIDVRGLAPPPPRPSAPVRRGPRLGLQEYMQKSGPARSGGSSR